MIADVWTVARKEFKEILAMGGGGRRGWIGQLFFLGVFGILLPAQSGRAWVESPLLLVSWGWLPFLLAVQVVADSFAGERERHTLETLLASRLPDRAILFGKLAAVVGYACGATWLALAAGIVTVNVVAGQGRLLFYPPLTFAGILAFSLLGSGLAASAGVLVSLRAATARQAAQSMSLVMLLLFSPVFIFGFLPIEIQARVFGRLTQIDLTQAALLAFGVLLVLNAVFIAAALARFQRARLILD